jgi:hypothetical protein
MTNFAGRVCLVPWLLVLHILAAFPFAGVLRAFVFLAARCFDGPNCLRTSFALPLAMPSLVLPWLANPPLVPCFFPLLSSSFLVRPALLPPDLCTHRLIQLVNWGCGFATALPDILLLPLPAIITESEPLLIR